MPDGKVAYVEVAPGEPRVKIPYNSFVQPHGHSVYITTTTIKIGECHGKWALTKTEDPTPEGAFDVYGSNNTRMGYLTPFNKDNAIDYMCYSREPETDWIIKFNFSPEKSWEKLESKGKYNKVYASTFKFRLPGSEHRRWVCKMPLDPSSPFCNPERAIKMWQRINPRFNAYLLKDDDNKIIGWLSPFVGKLEAPDALRAQELLRIYREQRIIITDPYVKDNCLLLRTIDGKEHATFTDIDLTYDGRNDPKTPVSRGCLAMTGQESYAEEVRKAVDLDYEFRLPLTVKVLKVILYLEKNIANIVDERLNMREIETIWNIMMQNISDEEIKDTIERRMKTPLTNPHLMFGRSPPAQASSDAPLPPSPLARKSKR